MGIVNTRFWKKEDIRLFDGFRQWRMRRQFKFVLEDESNVPAVKNSRSGKELSRSACDRHRSALGREGGQVPNFQLSRSYSINSWIVFVTSKLGGIADSSPCSPKQILCGAFELFEATNPTPRSGSRLQYS
eukprot:scaffold1869_cov122-Cylindrotheca_fusiformis.AAC.39